MMTRLLVQNDDVPVDGVDASESTGTFIIDRCKNLEEEEVVDQSRFGKVRENMMSENGRDRESVEYMGQTAEAECPETLRALKTILSSVPFQMNVKLIEYDNVLVHCMFQHIL